MRKDIIEQIRDAQQKFHIEGYHWLVHIKRESVYILKDKTVEVKVNGVWKEAIAYTEIGYGKTYVRLPDDFKNESWALMNQKEVYEYIFRNED